MNLSEETIVRIEREARNFASYNYISMAKCPHLDLADFESWPHDAKVSYYSIKNYLEGVYQCPGVPGEFNAKSLAGATAEAERSEIYRQALEEIKQSANYECGVSCARRVYQIAKQALRAGEAKEG